MATTRDQDGCQGARIDPFQRSHTFITTNVAEFARRVERGTPEVGGGSQKSEVGGQEATIQRHFRISICSDPQAESFSGNSEFLNQLIERRAADSQFD